MKCSKCGTYIKNVYYVDGKAYGIECFKTVMGLKREKQANENRVVRELKIQELKEKRELKRIQELEENKTRSAVIYEVLIAKNMKNIKNEYKINLRNEVIKEYELCGSLDDYTCSLVKQNLITTNKDNLLYSRMLIESMTDDELIEDMKYMYYNDDEIIELLDSKLNEFKSKYKYEYDEDRGIIFVNDIIVKYVRD